MRRSRYPEYKDVPRICYACGGTKTTYHSKTGAASWLFNHGTKLMLCQFCYDKYIRMPGFGPTVKGLSIRYFNKFIRYRWLMRTGFCSHCPNNVHDGSCNVTHMHHRYYLVICPWFGIQELCPGCHTKIGSHVKKSNHWAQKRQALGIIKETRGMKNWARIKAKENM